jgi:DNA-binding FadR family transcriptional regulator
MNAFDLRPPPRPATRKDRLFRRIADELALWITSGAFEPGQRLPSERELAKRLRVSRPSVREALILLQVEGKVEARNGWGIFVTRAEDFGPPAPFGADHHPCDVLRARRVVEGEVAAMAARERTQLDVEAIRHALAPLEDLAQDAGFGDARDRRFHLTVAEATHSDAMVTLVGDLCGAPRRSADERSTVRHWAAALRAANLIDHRALAHAIEWRDARRARVAMHRVLDRTIWVATRTQAAKNAEIAAQPARRALETHPQ